jgi:hypothetical protein
MRVGARTASTGGPWAFGLAYLGLTGDSTGDSTWAALVQLGMALSPLVRLGLIWRDLGFAWTEFWVWLGFDLI